jgi:hypothetical protein
MSPLLVVALLVAAPPEPFQVAQPSIDAGEVRVGPTLVRRFAFVNAGAEPLTVTGLTASCGCATPALPQRTYRPGERGELALEVNTLSQPAGANRWAVRVAYRCGDHTGGLTLELTARLVREIDITPAALMFQGHGAVTASVSIQDTRLRPFRVESLATSAPYLKAVDRRGFAYVRDTGSELRVCNWDILVEVAADCPEGRHSETITVTTDDPVYRTIKLPVTIIREPKRKVTASPARLTLVAGGSAVVQLRGADGQAVQVEAIEASVPALTGRWAAGPGNFATVRVRLDRAQWRGEMLTGEVRVRLREPAGETIVIPVLVRAGDD